MYKKAGIVVAVALVGIAVFIGVFGSCGGNGGVRVSTVGSGGSSAENSKTTTTDKKGSQEAVNGSNGDVGVSSQSEINNESHSQIDDNESSLIIESSVDNESSNVEEQFEESSDTENKLIEIDESSIKYDYVDKEMGGKIKEKVTYSLNNTLVNSFKILAENGETYEYFVPQSAYDSMRIDTKVTIAVRIYFDEGVSIVKVLSLKVD